MQLLFYYYPYFKLLQIEIHYSKEMYLLTFHKDEPNFRLYHQEPELQYDVDGQRISR